MTQKIDARIEAKLEEHHFDQMSSDISTLKGQLSKIDGFVRLLAEKQMQQSAVLSPPEFQKGLQSLATTLEVAKLSHASSSPVTIKKLQAQLSRADYRRPEFWSAASALISYRSPAPPKSNIPKWTDKKPNTIVNFPGGIIPPPCDKSPCPGVRITFNPEVYEDCEIDLNAPFPLWNAPVPYPAPPQSPPPFPNDTVECHRCIVLYDGGPIPLFGLGVKTIQFTDCIFEVQATPKSPQVGRNFITSLLAANDQDHIQYKPSGG